MTESIGTARLDIVVDTSGFDAAISSAKRSVSGMSTAAQAEYNKLNAVEKRRVDSLIKQADTLKLTREQQILYNASLKGVPTNILDELKGKLGGAAGAAKSAAKEFNAYGVSAKQTAAALRGVPAQVTDIVTALASGQRPFTVLIQQGGQLKDMFGGIVPAARALGGALLGLVNPYTLAAGAVLVFGAALKSAAEESDNLNRAIILSGNFAKTSADGLRDIGKSAAAATASTVSSATEAAAKVVATGRFTAEQVERVTQAALNMQRVAGVAIDDTISKFVQLADNPVSAIETLNKSQNAFAKQTRDQVKAFDEQGKAADAASLAIEDYASTLDSRSRQVEANLSGWSRLWMDVGHDASSAFDEIKIGLTKTDDSLKATIANTFSLSSAFNGMFTLAIGAFSKLEQARNSAAKAAGSFANVIGSTDSVSADFGRTRGLPENFGLNVAPPEKAKTGRGGGRARSSGGGGSRSPREMPNFAKDAATDAARLAEQELRATEAFKDMAATLGGPLAQAQREHAKRVAELNDLAAKSPVAAAGLTEALRQEAAQYAKTTAEIQRQLDPIGQVLEAQRLELDMIGKSNAEREVMNALLAAGTDLRTADAQAALAQARANQTEAESRQRSIDLMDDFRQGAANALTDFVTGAKSAKDALKDFFDDLAAQITKAIANKWMDQLFGAQGSDGSGTAGGGWLNAIMGLFGGGSANGNAFINGQQVQAFANGGVVSRPTMFGMSGGRFGVMGEAGPEAILPLHRGPDGKLGVRMEAANDDRRYAGPAVVNQTLVLQGRPDSRTPAQYEQAAARAQNRVTSRNR